jgi:secretion/DNA translocation related CpaE-like protein
VELEKAAGTPILSRHFRLRRVGRRVIDPQAGIDVAPRSTDLSGPRIVAPEIRNVSSVEVSSRSPASPVVLTTDQELLDHVLAVAAVAGVEPHVVSDISALRVEWPAASMVVIGVDSAPRIAGLALARRTDTYLVGHLQSQDQLSRWSVQLGAAVVTLPDGATWLASAMAERGSRPRSAARLIALVGGAGGVGCSTVAAGLSFVAALRGHRTLLLDCDPLGGGIDLLVGAERIEGWRWPQLASASGELGDLTDQLPQVDELDILSMARGPQSPQPPIGKDPGLQQIESVLSSATRSYDLVVADLPRALDDGSAELLRQAHHVVLVVPATIRGIAASRRVSVDLTALGPSPVVLVRRVRFSGIASEAVADALGFPMIGVISDEPGLQQGAERGDPPGRVARSPMSRTCTQLLDHLMPNGTTP